MPRCTCTTLFRGTTTNIYHAGDNLALYWTPQKLEVHPKLTSILRFSVNDSLAGNWVSNYEAIPREYLSFIFTLIVTLLCRMISKHVKVISFIIAGYIIC